MLLTGAHAELLLDETKVCPEWVLGNDGGVGYYRVRTPDERIAERVLREGALGMRERLAAILDVGGQVDDGNVPAATALKALPALAADKDPTVAAEAGAIAWRIASKPFVPPEMEERWAKYVEKTFGDRARRLGFRPARGEDEDVQGIRDQVLSLVAVEGRDKRVAGEARALAKKWLDDRKTVDADAARNALWIAARTGDRELYEVMRAEAARSQEPSERSMLLAALVSFGDPVLLRRGLDGLLADAVAPGDAAVALGAAAKNDVIGEAVVREWVRQNFDALVKKLPTQIRSAAIHLGGGCDEPSRRKHEAFFSDKLTQMVGGKRVLAQTLERMDDCVAARKVQEASAIGFLRGL
jgi:alanyl aminopeptidase